MCTCQVEDKLFSAQTQHFRGPNGLNYSKSPQVLNEFQIFILKKMKNSFIFFEKHELQSVTYSSTQEFL